ncbi:MAG TPA: MotA/TolQ/ExbB proton channel family protein [Pseudolabrys sp.]|nr:MotA/TolQ/ExbB proton channel family protein [Pseudolabrys sp.]
MEELKSFESWRPWVAVVSVAAGVGIILILYYTLSDDWAHTLLDRGHTYPFSVQNGMWIAFAMGLGEIAVRIASARAEMRQLRKSYLPEDPRVILQADDLPDIYKQLKGSADRNRCFLPRLIDRCILQFQASLSTAQSASLMNTSVEMFLHEVDLRYNMIRYICWVIPSLGFIGTVVGIGRALEFAGAPEHVADPNLLTTVTGMLAVSFNGTFLALVMASVLVLLQNIIQSKEEHALNLAGQYCLDNLINRLYVAK